MSELTLNIDRVGKMYRIFAEPRDKIFDALGLSWLMPWKRKRVQEFWPLRDISLQIKPGERVALIGRNGAGKSTLLKMIVGNVTPSTGTIKTNGKIQALMELGTGFHPEFTGRENIKAVLSYHGLSSTEMNAKMNEIIEFSELEEFIDRPVKTYSAGMYTRLAFAASTSIAPEVLIVDEILSTGDAYFSGKCIERMKKLTSGGTTLLFVSHDMGSLQLLCDRGVWIEQGRVKMDGDLLPVSKAYLASIRDDEERRLRANSMALSRKELQEVEARGAQMELFHLDGVDHVIPQKPLHMARIAYGVGETEMGVVAGSKDSASRLMIDPYHMNWNAARKVAGKRAYPFADFGGIYHHAPWQIDWAHAPIDGRWMEIEYLPSATHPVLLERYNPHTQTFVTLATLSAEKTKEWKILRMQLPALEEVTAAALPELDLQVLSRDERYGSGEIMITAFAFIDSDSKACHSLTTGENAAAVFEYHAHEAVHDPVAVVAIYRPDGVCALQVFSNREGEGFGTVSGAGRIQVNFEPLQLGAGDYIVSIALFKEMPLTSSIEPPAYDLHDRCYLLKMSQPHGLGVTLGLVNQPATWQQLSKRNA